MNDQNHILSLTDITSSLSTADHLSSLMLSVQTAQQIVVPDGQAPNREQLQILPWRDIDAILSWWTLARQHDPEITWDAFLEVVIYHLHVAQEEVVALRLAYYPTLQQLDELTELIRARFSPTALIKLEYQPELIAGCVIEVQGQRYDYSADTWLPEFMNLPSTNDIGKTS